MLKSVSGASEICRGGWDSKASVISSIVCCHLSFPYCVGVCTCVCVCIVLR